MATAEQVITAGLKGIIVLGDEDVLEPSEGQDFIFAMNNYMFDLDASGISLGYTEVTNVKDIITVPLGALRGLISNVAIEVSPQYGGIVSQALIKIAAEGFKTMLHLGTIITPSRFPSTLPIGSGNEGDTSFNNNHFFIGTEAEILAEVSGAIGLESDTVPA